MSVLVLTTGREHRVWGETSGVKVFLVRSKLYMARVAWRKVTRMTRVPRTHPCKPTNLSWLHHQGEAVITVHCTCR